VIKCFEETALRGYGAEDQERARARAGRQAGYRIRDEVLVYEHKPSRASIFKPNFTHLPYRGYNRIIFAMISNDDNDLMSKIIRKDRLKELLPVSMRQRHAGAAVANLLPPRSGSMMDAVKFKKQTTVLVYHHFAPACSSVLRLLSLIHFSACSFRINRCSSVAACWYRVLVTLFVSFLSRYSSAQRFKLNIQSL